MSRWSLFKLQIESLTLLEKCGVQAASDFCVRMNGKFLHHSAVSAASEMVQVKETPAMTARKISPKEQKTLEQLVKEMERWNYERL